MPPVLAAIPAVISAASTAVATAASTAASTIATGLTTVGVGSATASAIGTSIASMAESALLSTAASLLSSRSAPGVQWRTAQGALETRRIPCGKVYTAGRSMGDPITWGGSNKHAVILNALADVPIGGISSFKVNGSTDTFNGLLINGYPAKFRNSETNKGYEIESTINPFTQERVDNFLEGKAWKFFVKFHFGADSQVADQWMIGSPDPSYQFDGPTNVPSSLWDSTAVGKNLAYARAYCFSDWDIFSGFPTFAYYLDGALMYDPSKDTTVGGSGSHRWGAHSTYEVSTNPAVIAYNIARGFFNSDGDMVYGSGYDAADLPLDFWIPAIQDCDELITDKDGTQSPRYSCSFEIDITEEPRKYLSICETAMAGRICRDRGQLLAYAGVAQTPIFTFTDADKVQSAANLYNQKLDLGNLKNTVTGKFLSVAECFVQIDAPPRESAEDIAEDGGIPLTDAMDLSMIQHGPTAQRVMEATRQRHRAQATATRTFLLPALNARKGQWIAGTSSAWTGTKWFEIVKAQTNIYNLTVTMALREVPYDLGVWDAATDELDKYTVTLTSADPVDPLEATGITAASLEEQGGDGSSPAGIAVSYIAVDDPSATQVELQIGPITASGSDGMSNSTTTFTDSVAVAFTAAMEGYIIVIEGAGASGGQYTGTISDYVSASAVTLTDATETSASSCNWMALGDTQCFYDSDTTSGVIKATNLLGNTPYAYRVKIGGIEGRQSVWSDWHTVTTAASITPDSAAVIALQEAQAAAAQLQSDANAMLDEAALILAQANLSLADAVQSNAYNLTKETKRVSAEYTGSINKTKAEITEITDALAGENFAIASRTTTIEAQLYGFDDDQGTVYAAVEDAATAYVTPLASLASTVTSLTAIFGDNSSSSIFKAGAIATSSGAYASAEFTVTATDGTHTATGGWGLDAVVIEGVTHSRLRASADVVQVLSNQFILCNSSGTPVTVFDNTTGLIKRDGLEENAATTFSVDTISTLTEYNIPGPNDSMDSVTAKIHKTFYHDGTGNGRAIDSSATSVILMPIMFMPDTSHDFWMGFFIDAFDGSNWVQIEPHKQYKFNDGHQAEPWSVNVTGASSTPNWCGVESFLVVTVPPGYQKVRGRASGYCSDSSKNFRIFTPWTVVVLESHR